MDRRRYQHGRDGKAPIWANTVCMRTNAGDAIGGWDRISCKVMPGLP